VIVFCRSIFMGDAAFGRAGRGYGTSRMSTDPAYKTGRGPSHIIVNNQVWALLPAARMRQRLYEYCV